MKAKRIILITGSICLTGALLSWADAEYLLRRYRWTVLDCPIQMEKGSPFSCSFTVDAPTDYWLAIACERSKEKTRLTPSPTVLERAMMDGTAFSIRYAITEQGHIMRVKNTLGSWFSTTNQMCAFGSFQACPRKTYHISGSVDHVLPELAAASPRLRIETSPSLWKKTFIHVSFLFFLQIGLVVIGLFCIVPIILYAILLPVFSAVFRRFTLRNPRLFSFF